MKRPKKTKKINIFLLIFIGLGIILILDGIISIALQPDQNALFQGGRIARTIIGSFIFLASFLLYNKKK